MSPCRVHLHEANTRDYLILNIRIPLQRPAPGPSFRKAFTNATRKTLTMHVFKKMLVRKSDRAVNAQMHQRDGMRSTIFILKFPVRHVGAIRYS